MCLVHVIHISKLFRYVHVAVVVRWLAGEKGESCTPIWQLQSVPFQFHSPTMSIAIFVLASWYVLVSHYIICLPSVLLRWCGVAPFPTNNHPNRRFLGINYLFSAVLQTMFSLSYSNFSWNYEQKLRWSVRNSYVSLLFSCVFFSDWEFKWKSCIRWHAHDPEN